MESEERRRGLTELVASVKCLADNFEAARTQIADRFDAHDRQLDALVQWRDNEAAPVLKELRGVRMAAIWVGGVSTLLCALVVWIFLTTYGQLQRTAELTNENAKAIAAIFAKIEAENIMHHRYESGNMY